ncbi:hypothetical protein AB3S75_043867 [Citrus x aurantiifolia]
MKMLSSNCKLLLRLSLCASLLMIICMRCSSSRTLQGHEYDGEFSIVGYSPGVLTSTDKLVELFESWMLKRGKSYESTEEKLHRFEIFKDNLKHIDARNRELQITSSSYWLGLNEFSDMSHEEFKNKYLTGLNPGDDEFRRRSHHYSSSRSSGSSSNHFLYKNVEDLPQSVDWRKKGAVTYVKNQNPCGGCWAFSAVAAVEGINQIVTGNLTALSEQELLSCDTNNFGCEGGLLFYAFEYIASNGIHAEEDYPFVGDQANSSCKLIDKAAAAEVVTISGYQNVPENDEGSLLKALANQPVSVGIEASSKDFQHYSGGIFDGSCGTYPNHAVTAVGYGSSSSPEAVDYIIVKNSWGPKWGEGGYIRIKRNTGLPGGLCAINKLASFPIKFKTT